MRTLVGFVAGVLVGVAIQTTGAQTPPSRPIMRLNHVAVVVKDLPEALKYYQDKVGFQEVLRNPNGRSAYLQISKDTFLEVQQQMNEQTPLGLNHFGLELRDIKGSVEAFRARGLMIAPEPGAPSAFSGGILSGLNDPVYPRIELTEQPPDGKLRKASEAWQQPW